MSDVFQSVEERFKQLESDKTRLNQDKSTFEQKLNQTEGARQDLFYKNRVKLSHFV